MQTLPHILKTIVYFCCIGMILWVSQACATTEDDSARRSASKSAPAVWMVVSYYGKKHHGRTMARGGQFDMNNPTLSAHKTLPIGTKLLLTNPQNGLEQVSCVRDRGPYVRGRDLDASEAAAVKLDFKPAGHTSLLVRVIGMCQPYVWGKEEPRS